MSHNIVLSKVRYDDLKLLEQVVHDLSNGKARLVRNQTRFRTFKGQPDDCDHCIVMPGPHDIGLRRRNDGGYDLVFDPYAMDMVFAARSVHNGYNENIYVGALAQEYLLRAAEIKAAQSGFGTQRIKHDNGSVSLVMERAA
jgi:hypothetical protein